MLILMISISFPLGALFLLPNAVFADVVQHGEDQTGIKREGVYTGVRRLLVRMITGVGTFLIVPFLSIGDSKDDYLGIMLIFLVAGCIMGTGGLIFLKHPFKM